ncbi:MAG: alpha/beta hydrolase, partial [Actinobacteria bacterium]|nr:alpha/beta hydrolase [Actinomycetota bacterium]
LMCGGAMGGVLGPAEGLYFDLAETYAKAGIGTVRVGYRKPNDLGMCMHDLAAAADLCTRSGATRFVTMGHSFGGAVALNAGIAFRDHCAGIVLLSTQSAGCEAAEQIGTTPLLLLHGDHDQILPHMASEMVRMLAGKGELVLLDGAGHLLTEAAAELRERLGQWIPSKLSDHADSGLPAPPS